MAKRVFSIRRFKSPADSVKLWPRSSTLSAGKSSAGNVWSENWAGPEVMESRPCSPSRSKSISDPSGNLRTMSWNICAGTVVAPSPLVLQGTVSTSSMSRSVAVSFSSFLAALMRTLERMGMVFRRSTTLATCASALARPGLSMVSRMVVRYPKNEGFSPVRSTLAEALGLGPNAYEPVRNEELPLRPCRAGDHFSRATTA